jgi:hypothetical protein
MQKKDSAEELKNNIRLVQVTQSENRVLLKEQLLLTYDSIKPSSLIRSTLKEVTSSPFLVGNLAGTVIGLTTGYLSNKVVIGSSASLLRKLFGRILQFGVTRIISKNSGVIELYGKSIFKHLFSKRKTDS